MGDTLNDRLRVIELMKAFISGPVRSLGFAGQLEGVLEAAFPDNPDVNDLVISLASYRPEGGPHLHDEREMVELLNRYLPIVERLAGDHPARGL
jgi:hypothetical protein